MKIEISRNAGFCFGVKRAIDTVNALLKEGKKVATLGPIIHNPQMIKKFEEQGVKIVNDIKDLNSDYTVVVRSHGVDKKTIDQLNFKKINYIDATCPFVKKIHKIVNDENNKNKIAFIAGNKDHPEIIGIVGNCLAKYYVFSNSNELLSLIKLTKIEKNTAIFVIAQTTFDVGEWNKSLDILKNNYTNLQIFDTICNTTTNRQKEAEHLAKRCDVMIVIGGKNSSNTIKLKNICKKYCKTYHIETKHDLPINEFIDANYVGITAGASTPVDIIEEVKKTMGDIIKNNDSEATFEQLLEESLSKMNTDKRVKGIVEKIAPTEVFVDIGRKQSGIIPLSELTDDSSVRPEDIVKIGDELDLLIMKTDDQDGTIMLSKKRVDASKNWDEVVASQDKILSGKVVSVVNGGVIALCNDIKVFIPASLTALNRNEPLETLKNQIVDFRIIEIDERRKRIVGSIKAVVNERKQEQSEKFWATAKVGDICNGIVRSFTPYGAFIDLGGLDGMVYISDLSWDKLKHPSDVLELGQQVSVIIKDLDRERNRVALGYKEQFENPWDIFVRDHLDNGYSVGSEIDVEIVKLANFGAFARIIPGVKGLIHISEISNEKIEKPSDVLKVGDIVKAKILDIDLEKHRISLSLK